MQFRDLVVKAMRVKAAYDKYNKSTFGKVWSRENVTEGFIGDAGDLMKLVMAKDGLRHTEKVDEKLAHELSDCLWSIIVLAELYGLDLERSFMKTMDELEADIESKLSQK